MNWLINLIFPTKCVVCEAAPEPLCKGCAPRVQPRILPGADFPILRLGELEGSMLKVLTGYKDSNLVSLSGALVDLVLEAISLHRVPEVDLVAVPARNRHNYRKRGYDPALEIAKRAFRDRADVVQLRSRREFLDQRSLDFRGRKQNLDGAFSISGLSGKQVLLFDDVLTTGATMKEMSRAVQAAGGKVIFGCVLAETIANF